MDDYRVAVNSLSLLHEELLQRNENCPKYSLITMTFHHVTNAKLYNAVSISFVAKFVFICILHCPSSICIFNQNISHVLQENKQENSENNYYQVI